MASRCIVCKKELPEGSKLPVCEYHKGVAAENAKKAGISVCGSGGIGKRENGAGNRNASR